MVWMRNIGGIWKENMGDQYNYCNMQETENIHFESMPDFGSQNGPKAVVEKEYDSLYDEIADKCHPNRFLDNGYDKGVFSAANSIYYELLQRKGWPDEQLKDLRNRAIFELGIHFSAKKQFDYLSAFFDPRIYTQMEPYPYERVENAKRYHDILNDNKDDIIALEHLEKDAEEFIAERKDELETARKLYEKEERDYFEKLNEAKKKEADEAAMKASKDNERIGITVALSSFVLLVLILISVFQIKK